MGTVKVLIDYIRTTQVPLVWTFDVVTITLTIEQDCLCIKSDSEVPDRQSMILPEHFSLLIAVEFICRCTVVGIDKKGVYISEQADVFEKVLNISNLPEGYRKSSVWLITQFELGNKLPLIDRAQELAGDIFNIAGGDINENRLVIDYYQYNVDMQSMSNAIRLARDLRVAIAHMSSVAR